MKLFIKSTLAILVLTLLASGQESAKADPAKELKPILDKGIAIWNNGNLDQVGEVWDESVVRSVNQLPDVKGVEGMKKVISGFRSAYPDAKLTADEVIFAENKATLRWTFTGTNTGPGEMPPTGKQIKIWGITVLHFANGKVAREIVAYNQQALMEQLGFTMTPPSGEIK
jgi:steroid delta-isomerase-like uncharacterized protein